MNRFTTRSASNMSMLASAFRRPAGAVTLRAAAAPFPLRPYSNGKSSAPKSAEEASAASGGSRSKEAVETGSSPTGGPIPDGLAQGDARGRTGGGPALDSSVHPPAQPRISNASVPGERPDLSAEQQAEVDEHNRDFENKHGKAEPAADDKVDKSFWSGKGSRYNKG
ncbi:uncharacterized protein B0H64DRAFT_412439 [Chaetomium fimeti]|uniref:Succinate dehydrogenase assembly factor 4, mitochondrial n=1 Tax=Chaetomium fimeti TaxID=1854472 RepID=A0AAE0H5Z9_9PEZI|nr:hypothetical protein B0H64DRAFT_412439 [Chaetomium fimeti]